MLQRTLMGLLAIAAFALLPYIALGQTPAPDVEIRIHVTTSEITMVMDSKVPVRAIEVAFNNVKQFPNGLTIETPLGPAQYELQTSKKVLVFLIYEFGTATIAPGTDTRVFRVYTTIDNPDQITFNRLIIADEENNEITNVRKSIIYGEASSVSSTPTHVTSFDLDQNYPNPFNPGTTIPLSVHSYQEFALSIFSMDGKRIRTLHEGMLQPGAYRYAWDGRDDNGRVVPAGTYFYTLRTRDAQVTRSMILLQ